MLMQVTKETHLRSIVKGISWRIIATLTTMIVVFILTGEMLLALGIGIVDNMLKFVLYYFHERGWNIVLWGKITENDLKKEHGI